MLGLGSGVGLGLEALQVCACAAARTRASEGSPTGWCLGRRVPLSVLLHAWQELLSAHRRRRPGLARQTAVFDALDSLVEPVLNRLFMPVQPSGAGTCAGTERDGLGSPTCTCHYARLLARAACQHEWGLRTTALLLERLLELLQLVLLLREQLGRIRLAPRWFLEFGGRLCD